MRARRRALEVVLLAAVIACPVLRPAPVAAAPSAPTATSRQKEMQARKAFAAGEWKEALALFADLYAETLHPVYLRNIGRCHQKLRDPDRAIDAFRDYLAKNKKVSADERTEIEGYIKEMEALKEAQRRQNANASAEPDAPSLGPSPVLTPRPV